LQLTFSEAVGGKAGDIYTLPTPRRISYDQASITVKRFMVELVLMAWLLNHLKVKVAGLTF